MSSMDNRHWCQLCYVNALGGPLIFPTQLVLRVFLVGVRELPLFIILKVCYLQFIYLSP